MIHLYGKPGCAKCDAAKDKLDAMGVEYKYHNIEYHSTPHDGWREDKSREAFAAYQYIGEKLPVFILEGDLWLTYPQAMKRLRQK